jgi:hypothetical protein
MQGFGDKPKAIQIAVILTVINGVAGLLFALFWPDIKDRGTFIAVSVVFTVIMLVAAWLLLSGLRWGAIVALVIQVLNILVSLPGFIDPDPVAIAYGAAVSIVLSLGTLWFAWKPEARAYWNKR